MLAYRPDLSMLDVRGNVRPGVAKLDHGDYDALVLARAGLQRLGLDARVAEIIEPEMVVPAAGQGALAVQARSGDVRVAELLRGIDHPRAAWRRAAERAFLARLEGGCQAPVGALGTWSDDALTLTGVVAALRRRASRPGQQPGDRRNGSARRRPLASAWPSSCCSRGPATFSQGFGRTRATAAPPTGT